jgi:protein translocase SecG subunit
MKLITIFQLVIAVALIAAILMQNRGGGLSGIFGGGGGGNVYMTKRGLEKKIFIATIVLSVLFFAVSLLNVTFFS